MPLDPALRDKIIAAVDKGFDAQVKFTQDMVRHASTRGNEHTMQDLGSGFQFLLVLLT